MFIKLYETVVISKGATRALIFDTHSEKTNFIPNDLVEFIISINDTSIDNYLLKYDSNERDIINEYIEFIIKYDYGFFCATIDEFKLFPKKSVDFESPFEVTNCIVDVCKNSTFDLTKLFAQINILNIPYLQIRAATDYTNLQTDVLLNLLKVFNNTSVNEIFLLLPYSENIDNYIKATLITEKYLTVLFYAAHNNTKDIRVFNNVNINYSTNLIVIPTSCGNIKIDNFIINEDFYREGLQFNNCLNRKVCVDQKGEIKNCPSMKKSFGNIKDISLKEVLNKKDFKDLWNITKDQISICKDCEFMHICTDCRAYTQNPNDKYSKPLKCGYDPYKNEWEDWSTNPLSKKAIEHYGLTDIITE